MNCDEILQRAAGFLRKPGPRDQASDEFEQNRIASYLDDLRRELGRSLPGEWTLVKKSTCYILIDKNCEVVASLAGPNAERNASIIALGLSASLAMESTK